MAAEELENAIRVVHPRALLSLPRRQCFQGDGAGFVEKSRASR